MAAVSEDISDRDLRAKLKEHGINSGPITSTTKRLYIRKLNKKLTGSDSDGNTSTKKPTRKSLSPRRSPGRSSARDTRRSLGSTSSPARKLVGFSSDEEESANDPTVLKPRRISGRFMPGSSLASVSTHSDHEERPLRFRKPPVDTSSHKVSEDEEKTQMDGRVDVPRTYYEFNEQKAKPRPYSGLRNLFNSKSVVDSKKVSARRTPPPISYDVEDEEEPWRNVCYHVWTIAFLFAVLLLLVFVLPLLWNVPDPNSVRICGPSSSDDKVEACLSEQEYTQLLLENLQYDLAENSGLLHCGYTTEGRGEIRKDDLGKWISKFQNSKHMPCDIIKNMIKQAQSTPGFDLSFVDENGTIVNDTETLSVVKTTLVLKPLFCRIREALAKVVFQLVFLFAVIILGVCIYFLVKYRWMLRERKTRQMYELVDQILEVLKNHHSECQRNKDLNPYLAIPHVRDMLIKPSERESMKTVWDQAVKFLSAKDSRVRVESQRIAGEDFEVWRLLHHGTPISPKSSSSSDAKEGKVWQGQAFENFTTAVNPPLISPTPCLKIRNMFEPVMEIQDQWHIFIQDAILEKCNEKGAAIVHIAVDQSSSEGCVYVKCANHASSGRAFRAIHGCWFDGRLVTVKFLTLKRYHQRFPESVTAKEPIKPSGTSSSTIPKLKSEPVNESDSDSDSEIHVTT